MDEIAELVEAQLRVGNAYTREYLRQVKRKLGIESDYALAKRLQVSKSAVSNYQNGSTAFSDSVCQRVADILEIDPALVVSFIEVDRHSSASFKELKTRVWIAETVRQALGSGAVHSALLACLVALGFITSTPSAHAVVTDVSTSSGSVYYVKLAMALFQRSISRRLGKLRSFVQGITDVQSARPIAPPLAFA